MRLITEIQEEVNFLTEEKDGHKKLYIEGVFMQSVPNKNKRIYPEEVLHKEVNRYIAECVSKKRAYGELGHPQGPQINLDRVSHLIESLHVDGKNVIGKALVVETQMGKTVMGLLNGGANLGVSSRGLGSLKEGKEGLMEVQGDFRLVTAADIVADPSAPDAFVRGIMEDVEYWYDASSGTYVQKKIELMQETMKKMTKQQLEESKLRIFDYFIQNLVKNK